MRFILRPLIFVHRWVGIVLCIVFLLWFPSGIGMMYWGYPGVSAGDRLDHSPKLDPAKIVLSPEEAAEKLNIRVTPSQIRLNSFDGRPVYRIGGGGRGGGARGGGGGRIVYADTGEEQTEVSPEMLGRIAAAWTGQPLSEATKEAVTEVDQWTVGGVFRIKPLYKYSWPDGQQVYLNGANGEVAQYTTFAKRVAAHVSAIPHWLYYTPLRKHQPFWLEFMIWSSLIGTIGAIVGIVVAALMYSPKKRYRLAGQPTGIPYRGQKRWHWLLGMVFGLATVTWTFSGLLTLGPFPLVQRLTQTGPREEQPQAQQQQSQQASPELAEQGSAPGDPPRGDRAGAPRRENGERSTRGDRQSGDGQARGRGGAQSGRRSADDGAIVGNRGGNADTENAARGGEQASANTPTPDGTQANRRQGRGRVNGQQGIAGALRGRVTMTDFAFIHPRDVLLKAPDLDVRELEWTSFASTPLFSASLPDGKTQLLSLDGMAVNGFDRQRLVDLVRSTVPDPKVIQIDLIDQYDLYYLDRTRQRPLPVLRVLINDADETRYYIDPKSARVVTTYSGRNWVNRWLTNALHSLDFPFLYNHRPLWDIVVIAFMVCGTALCVTSLVLAWRTLGRTLKRAAANDVLARET